MRNSEVGKKVAQKLLDACVMLSRGPVFSNRPSDLTTFRPASDSNVSESPRLRSGFFLKPLGNEAV